MCSCRLYIAVNGVFPIVATIGVLCLNVLSICVFVYLVKSPHSVCSCRVDFAVNGVNLIEATFNDLCFPSFVFHL